MMGKGNGIVSNFTNGDLMILREIDAPRRLVFESWIDPKHAAQWWGPENSSNLRCEIDARSGGAIRIDVRKPDGTVELMGGFYEEIIHPEKLVFSSSALDSLGHPLFDAMNSVTFADHGDRTGITIQAEVIRTTEEAEPYLSRMEAGWKQSLDRLNAYMRRFLENPGMA